MAATSAAASGRVDIARRVLPSASRPRSMPRRRSCPAIITPQPNGVSSENASGPQEVEREGRVGHLRDHRLDLGRQPVRDRPLDVPQVAGADQHDRVAEPGLLDQPRRASPGRPRARCASARTSPPEPNVPRALCRITWNPRSASGRTVPAADQRAPAVGAAHQGDRELVAARSRRPPVRQQHGPVRHRHRQIPLDDQVPGQRRVQPELALDQAAHQVHADGSSAGASATACSAQSSASACGALRLRPGKLRKPCGIPT